VVVSVAIVAFGSPEIVTAGGVRPGTAVIAVAASAVIFGAFGFLVALASPTLNGYLIRTAIPFIVISAPLLVFLPPTRSAAWIVFPAAGPVSILARSLGGALPEVPWSIAAAWLATGVWAAIVCVLARYAYDRHRDRLLGVWT
jgi:hypothetical protein